MIVCTQKNISPDTWYITPYLNMMKLQTQGQKYMSLYASMRIAHVPSVYEKGMPNKNQEQWLGLNNPPACASHNFEIPGCQPNHASTTGH